MPRTKKDYIRISTHTGKMEGLRSISTNRDENPNCKSLCKRKDSVCKHCYAHSYIEMRPALRKALNHNTKVLKTEVPSSDIPLIKDKYFRFEAFGDLLNKTHLRNYIQIARANPKTKFALFTKRIDVLLDSSIREGVFFRGVNYKDPLADTRTKTFVLCRIPENIVFVSSSLFINNPYSWSESVESMTARLGLNPGQIKVFTVYDKEYLLAHPEVDINCGSKCCAECHQCYDADNGITVINEILKSDAAFGELILKLRNKHMVSKLLARK